MQTGFIEERQRKTAVNFGIFHMGFVGGGSSIWVTNETLQIIS